MEKEGTLCCSAMHSKPGTSLVLVMLCLTWMIGETERRGVRGRERREGGGVAGKEEREYHNDLLVTVCVCVCVCLSVCLSV